MKACDKCHATGESVLFTSIQIHRHGTQRATVHADLCDDCCESISRAIGVEFISSGDESGGFGGSGATKASAPKPKTATSRAPSPATPAKTS